MLERKPLNGLQLGNDWEMTACIHSNESGSQQSREQKVLKHLSKTVTHITDCSAIVLLDEERSAGSNEHTFIERVQSLSNRLDSN